MTPTPVAINLLVNRDAAPFNDPDIRRAMQLTIDRKSLLDIIAEGQGDINGAMQSPPAGLWGCRQRFSGPSRVTAPISRPTAPRRAS